MDIDDTIAAIASPAGGGVRGIVRVCGVDALACMRPWFAPDAGDAAWQVSAATAIPGRLSLPEFHHALAADAFYWPGTRSYARQPTIELHLPGSPPVVEAALAAVCRCGARPARPGEFTLRAFLAGRIDLTRAEAVLGVVDAADRRRLDTALRQMAGGLAEPLDALRSELLNLLADVEAGLDFVDEDIEFVGREALQAQLSAARTTVENLAQRMSGRGESSELPTVVLIGPPNAGKSSLFNALVGHNKALVSAAAGTTRDYLTARIACGSMELELIDTAGVDDSTADTVALAAQRQMSDARARADVLLLCVDATQPAAVELSATQPGDTQRSLLVWTKCDLMPDDELRSRCGHVVSSRTGRGLAELRAAIAGKIESERAAGGDFTAATAVRCRESLRRAAESLSRACELATSQGGDELIACEIRLALDELGQVVGAVYTDDILDRIFSRFCIGK